jgi:hypothetical protein
MNSPEISGNFNSKDIANETWGATDTRVAEVLQHEDDIFT